MAAGEHEGRPNTQVAWITPPDPLGVERAPGDGANLTRIAGRYTVRSQVGVGGMGAVYVVLDHELDEIVALKMLRPELARRPGFAARFRQEVKLARRVTHPNVVRTFDLGEDTGSDGAARLFLTMEYVDGASLTRVSADQGRMPTARVDPILAGICAGLGAAHQAGVVHRDLKPDNVLVGNDGRVVLTDFGIARAVTPSAAAGTSPDPPRRAFVGTPAYMAPEQAAGDEVDHRADLYALGAILFELATGTPAWASDPGDDPRELARARTVQPAPDPRAVRPDLPEAVAAVIRRCMATDPAERYPSAAAVLDAWRKAAASGAPTEIRAAPRPPEVPHQRARTLAVLPFRAGTPEDAGVARGFAEELVDAFSMTRGLRVRPLGPERGADEDPGEIGRQLEVELVVDGAVRRSGTGWRVSLRTISVADGYQIGAWRFESADPLALVDQAAATVGRALTVELTAPARQAVDARAIDLYLRGKSLLRAQWFHPPEQALELLGEAHVLAPDDPDVLSAYATALARTGLFARDDQAAILARARSLAEHAVAVGPDRAEGWFALAACRIYGNDPIGAGAALRTALARAPGHAQAQGMLGGLQLEAAVLPEAMIRLRAAVSLDPGMFHARLDLARGHALLGEWDRAMGHLDGDLPPEATYGRTLTWARLRMWNRNLPPPPALPPPAPYLSPSQQLAYLVVDLLELIYNHGALPEVAAELVIEDAVDNTVGRMRATRKQYQVEMLLAMGRDDEAVQALVSAADSGLFDVLWMDRCPLLQPIRGRPEVVAARRKVADLARAVEDAADP